MGNEIEDHPLTEVEEGEVVLPPRPTFRHVRDGRTITPSIADADAYDAHPNWERAD